MERAFLAAGLFALLAGCSSPEPVQEVATGQIDGAVLSHMLQPFGGQPVYLMQTGARDDTSPLGGFTFRDVPVGTYTLLSTREGFHPASAIVDVEEGRVTKTILQHMPIPVPEPYFTSVSHSASEDVVFAGDECPSCAWEIEVPGDPKEIILQASWSEGSPLGNSPMQIEVRDEQGMVLFDDTVASGVTVSILGEDLREDVRTLQVVAVFGPEFTAQTRFRMEQLATLYYGATHDDLFYL